MITTRELRLQTLIAQRQRLQEKEVDPNVRKMMTTRDPEVAQAILESSEAERWRLGLSGSKMNVTTILSDNQWRGSRCFLIGGGPSLRGFNFERLRGEKIIAINRAYEFVPFADIMFSMDFRYFKWIKKGTLGADALRKFSEFKGVRLFLDTMRFPYSGVHTIHAIGRLGLSRTLRNGLYHGNNSGYGAINLALILGASPIYLLGYDMKFQYGESKRAISHFHSGYPSRASEGVTQSFLKDFQSIGRFLRQFKDQEIINLSPDSALTIFKKKRFEEII